jgi:GT2 family glycosyltransferase
LRPITKDLSVLIVTWNSADHIDDCLRAISDTVTVNHEIIVADNDSHDDTPRCLARARTTTPHTLLQTGVNLGFARANNFAMQVASGRNILLLNPDTQVLPHAIDHLVAHLDHNPTVGVVAPKLLNHDRTDQGTARAFPTPAAAIFGRRSPLTRLAPNNRWSKRFLIGKHAKGTQPFEVDWVSGACLMVKREAIEQAGTLDDGFFMHFEDADWCYRIKQKGFEVRCVPQAQVIHDQGGSRRGWPPNQIIAFHQGAYRFYTRNVATNAFDPRRPIAAAGLAIRAATLIAIHKAGAMAKKLPVLTRSAAAGGKEL